MATIRYLVDDVTTAVEFYAGPLGFDLVEQFGPAIAIMRRDDLDLWLAGPSSSAARPMPDGARPAPGGWNRLVVEVEDLGEAVGRLASGGAKFRNDIVDGPGGRQILVEDPAGNVVELFERAG
jgi:catechol 2,3-dioxygenase-like lactoylglutathione lyase family enzyme